jgi:peptidyl-prolyl cis-trans isomerase A (cyclophilin A)
MRYSIGFALVVALVGCGGGSDDEAGAGAADSVVVATPLLLNPRLMTETSPGRFRARFETTAGVFVVDVHRDWAPRGADRFYNLLRAGYYDSVYVHRVTRGLAQFGFYPDPRINNFWLRRYIGDDPVTQSNTRGRITFAHAGLNTRATQVFLNRQDNVALDAQGFAPFGEVVEGMDVTEAFYGGYGELAPQGDGPDPGQAAFRGNEYLAEQFPDLTKIVQITIEEAPGPP